MILRKAELVAAVAHLADDAVVDVGFETCTVREIREADWSREWYLPELGLGRVSGLTRLARIARAALWATEGGERAG